MSLQEGGISKAAMSFIMSLSQVQYKVKSKKIDPNLVMVDFIFLDLSYLV